jgi:hypothetical protein
MSHKRHRATSADSMPTCGMVDRLRARVACAVSVKLILTTLIGSQPMRLSRSARSIVVVCGFFAPLISPVVAASDDTSKLFQEVASKRALAGETRCGLSPEVGDGQRLVFARGISCRGHRHARGSSALGIVAIRLSGTMVRGWRCSSLEPRDAEMLCYQGRDRTSSIGELRAALRTTHIRAISP